MLRVDFLRMDDYLLFGLPMNGLVNNVPADAVNHVQVSMYLVDVVSAPRHPGRYVPGEPTSLWRISGCGSLRAQRQRLVKTAYVQMLRVGEDSVLLSLRFACGLLRQFRRQAAQLPYAGDIDKDTAGGKNRDAFYPPLFLPGRGKSGPDLRRLKRVRWMLGKLDAFLDYPFVKLHYRPLQRQLPYIFHRQPGTPALTETASVGQQSRRPQRQRHNPVPVLLGPGQFRE